MSFLGEIQKEWIIRQINKEALRDFRQDFRQLVDWLSPAFSLDGAVWNDASRREHGIRTSLEELQTYTKVDGGYLTRDDKKIEAGLAHLIKHGKFQGWVDKIAIDPVNVYAGNQDDQGPNIRLGLSDIDTKLKRGEMLGLLAVQAAKCKALLGGEGIREYYSQARKQAVASIELYEKAAEILFDRVDDKADYKLQDLLELARDRSSVDTKKIATAIGLSFAMVGCVAGNPYESGNFEPTIPPSENSPAISSPTPSDNLETPTAGMPEFESPIAATLVKMDSVRTEELRDKFIENDVVYYEVGIDPTNGKPASRLSALDSVAKKSMQLINSVVMSEPSGGKWECLIFGNNDGNEGVFNLVCNTENGMFIPRQIYDPTTGLMSWSFYIDTEGNYPVDFSEAYVVRPVIQFVLDENNLIKRGWMWSKVDGKLHEMKDVETQFKLAKPALYVDQYGAEADLEQKYGDGVYTWPDDGRPTLTFDNGMIFEWDGQTYVEVKFSEADRQILDAATEIEGITRKLDKLWGVVGMNEEGKMTKYWAYNPYNYDRGEWKDVVREENGHLIVKGINGKESIVYPERITLNVNGKEITYNTTARGYKENVTPQTPEEYKAVIEALAKAINEGKVLMPFAEGALKLTDLEKLDKYNDNATAKSVYDIRSDKWQEMTPDQIPYSPLAFPYNRDGLVVEGAVIVPVMLLDGSGKVTGFLAFQVVDNKWMKFTPTQEIQRLLDRDMINSGQTAMASPVVNKSIEACVKALDTPELDQVCIELFSQTSAIEKAFATSIASGEMSEDLVSCKLLPNIFMTRVAKAAKK